MVDIVGDEFRSLNIDYLTLDSLMPEQKVGSLQDTGTKTQETMGLSA